MTGKHKDKVWELLCCASKAHKENVNTIEDLTKTNTMLQQRNKELEEISRTNMGFNDSEARFSNKRSRTDDPTNTATIESTMPPSSDTSDVWGNFESLMTSTSKTYY